MAAPALTVLWGRDRFSRWFPGAITRFFAHCLKGRLMAQFYQI